MSTVIEKVKKKYHRNKIIPERILHFFPQWELVILNFMYIPSFDYFLLLISALSGKTLFTLELSILWDQEKQGSLISFRSQKPVGPGLGFFHYTFSIWIWRNNILSQIRRSLFSQCLYFYFTGEETRVGEIYNKVQSLKFLSREPCLTW